MADDRLGMSMGRDAAAIREAEREANREIEAAVTLGQVDRAWAPFPHGNAEYDAWYEAVFGATERELEEMAAAAARRYRSLRRVRDRRLRREARAAYIRARARLTAASGLETAWY